MESRYRDDGNTKLRFIGGGIFWCINALSIYIYYTTPELRIENCRFGSGKGARPL